jgi:hypothetical protein
MRTLGKARSGCNPNQKNFGPWNMNEVQDAHEFGFAFPALKREQRVFEPVAHISRLRRVSVAKFSFLKEIRFSSGRNELRHLKQLRMRHLGAERLRRSSKANLELPAKKAMRRECEAARLE